MTDGTWLWPPSDDEAALLPKGMAVLVTGLHALLGSGLLAAGARRRCAGAPGEGPAVGAQGAWCDTVVRDGHWVGLVVLPVCLCVLVGVVLPPRARRFGWVAVALLEVAFVGYGVQLGAVPGS